MKVTLTRGAKLTANKVINCSYKLGRPSAHLLLDSDAKY